MINGSYFGEVDIIFDRKRKYVASCETACELFYITRFEYETIIVKEFPHSNNYIFIKFKIYFNKKVDEKLRAIAKERDKRNEDALKAVD
jgi:hypothetical protein